MRILFALTIIVAFLSGCSEKQESITLKVHHMLPPKATAHAKFLVPWCDKITEESEGNIKCEIYPAMQLGGAPGQLYDQVRDGVVDVTWTVPGYSAGRFPSIEAFELPFMMRTSEASSKALWSYIQDNNIDEFNDVHLLGVHVHGPGYFHMTNKPIKKLEDLAGQKVRAPTRLTNKYLAALGATPVGMPVPSVPEALAKGVIDGALVPYEIVPAIKANELTKFHSETDHDENAIYTTTFVFAMNKEAYSRLTPRQKEIIDNNSGLEVSGWIGKVFSEADAAGKGTVAVDSVNTISATELTRWKNAAQAVTDAWISEMNEKGKDGLALVSSAKALTEKFNAQ